MSFYALILCIDTVSCISRTAIDYWLIILSISICHQFIFSEDFLRCIVFILKLIICNFLIPIYTKKESILCMHLFVFILDQVIVYIKKTDIYTIFDLYDLINSRNENRFKFIILICVMIVLNKCLSHVIIYSYFSLLWFTGTYFI